MRREVAGPFRAPPAKNPKRELAAPAIRRGGIPFHARLLAAGTITAAEYVRATQRDYDSLARRLEGFWKLPRSIELGDIVQQLYMASFEHARRWNPMLAPIGRFLVFNSMADTKKWLNEQRGARHGSDPSEHELLIDDVFVREDGTPVDPGELLPTSANQDMGIFVSQMLAGVGRGEDTGEAECLLALLFEDDESDALRTVVEGGVAHGQREARALLDSAKARAMALIAQ